MQRRKFSREFKLEAVRLVKERGVAVAASLLTPLPERICGLTISMALSMMFSTYRIRSPRA